MTGRKQGRGTFELSLEKWGVVGDEAMICLLFSFSVIRDWVFVGHPRRIDLLRCHCLPETRPGY